MNEFRIQRLHVRKLWGYRDVRLKFHKDVNCLIGRNGSGKTSIMYLLWNTLSADFLALSRADFGRLELDLVV